MRKEGWTHNCCQFLGMEDADFKPENTVIPALFKTFFQMIHSSCAIFRITHLFSIVKKRNDFCVLLQLCKVSAKILAHVPQMILFAEENTQRRLIDVSTIHLFIEIQMFSQKRLRNCWFAWFALTNILNERSTDLSNEAKTPQCKFKRKLMKVRNLQNNKMKTRRHTRGVGALQAQRERFVQNILGYSWNMFCQRVGKHPSLPTPEVIKQIKNPKICIILNHKRYGHISICNMSCGQS